MKKNIFTILVFIGLITFTTGYAYSNNLIDNSSDKNTSNNTVEYNNLKSETNNGKVTYTENNNISFNCELDSVSDEYSFSFELTNNSDKDVEITDISDSLLPSYLSQEIIYSNGSNVKLGDIIKSGEKKLVKVSIKYNHTIDKIAEENNAFSLHITTSEIY